MNLRRAPLFLICFILSLFSFTAPSSAQDPCDGLLAPRLIIGETARIRSGYGLSMKNQPATGAAGSVEVAMLPFGTVVTVLDGPRCNLGYTWWQVQLSSGLTGWAAEGNNNDYFMEPVVVGLDVYHTQEEGAQITRYFVPTDGLAVLQSVFSIPPVAATPGDGTWQQVEIDALNQALADVQTNCPDRFKGTIWENPDALANPLNVPLPALDYEYVPSPMGDRLLLVRNQHLEVPVCETVVPRSIGMTRVSVMGSDHHEAILFPFPQHGGIPTSEDRYAPSALDAHTDNVYLDEIVWSPQGKYIAFVVGYKARCGDETCYRFHMYIYNFETGQLYIPGEGRRVAWTNGGEQINFFRLVSGAEGTQIAHLFTARPDGTDRQEVWLPGGAVYISPEQRGLNLPWNEGGTRVVVGNAGLDEIMVLNINDRAFTPPIMVPDTMPPVNRLSVHLMKNETRLLWTTIRGDFVTQDVEDGEWAELTSTVASTGVPILQVRPFATGNKALIEMKDGSAYILDVDTDQLIPVTFSG